ncbi:MAG: hypothetical protein RR228_00135 [Bacilli bacterium]
MAYTTIYEDVIFIEGDNSKAKRLKEIKTHLGGFGAQFKNLDNVKSSLAQQVKLLNGNCLLDFKYGQKSSLLSIDDVKFFGNGVAGILDESEYKKIIDNN